MFKAKLIEDKKYYQLRRKQLLLLLLPGIPMAILVNFYETPVWLTGIGLAVYFLILFYAFRNQKSMLSLLGTRVIEIDQDKIQIKSKQGKLLENFELKSLEMIKVKKTYSMPNEGIKDMTREIKGKPTANHISIVDKGQEHRFDFELDSYYMISKLENAISHWKDKGYQIVTEAPLV